MRRTVAWLILPLLAGCAHAVAVGPRDAQDAFLLRHAPVPVATTQDEAWARDARQVLVQGAGRGLEDQVDVSAACGCVEGGDSGGGGGGGGGGVTPDIEGPKKAHLTVIVTLPAP